MSDEMKNPFTFSCPFFSSGPNKYFSYFLYVFVHSVIADILDCKFYKTVKDFTVRREQYCMKKTCKYISIYM